MTTEEIRRQIDRAIERRLDHALDDLALLCAQPSVSAYGEGMDDCAAVVAGLLARYGFQAEIMPTAGYPVVFAEAGAGKKGTLLFYLHYDVQPAEPLDLWESPPFELTRRGDKLFARGVVDDKGHIAARLAALAAVQECLGELPCNVKFIIEGEEELGSEHMTGFVNDQRQKLAADACIWEYGGVDYEGNPTQSLGMRGIFYVELSVRTASQDAHSGLGGSIFPNAAWRLTWALNTLKDRYENILIPGFYDNALPASELDLALLAELPDEAEQLRQMYGLSGFVKGQEGGLELHRAAVFEPTCTICGLDSGYQGPGSKTVLPAEARAKVDFRLVPEQSPEEILVKLRNHLDGQGFEDVVVTALGGTRPAKVRPDHPFVLLANEAALAAYGRPPAVSPMIGGSGPMYPFAHDLGLPIATAGVGHPGSQVHAPNENIRLDDFIAGIRHTAYILEAFGRAHP